MILWRCFAWDRGAAADEAGGALWFARAFQGGGRHDNPDAYGCLYLSGREASGIVEQLAQFRGNRLLPSMLRRRGLPLSVAAVELDDGAALVDLDEPAVLSARGLRPSLVATRQRSLTQPQALAAWEEGADCLRWWSTYESTWPNVTVFDRAAPSLAVVDVRELRLDDRAFVEAADLLGLTP